MWCTSRLGRRLALVGVLFFWTKYRRTSARPFLSKKRVEVWVVWPSLSFTLTTDEFLVPSEFRKVLVFFERPILRLVLAGKLLLECRLYGGAGFRDALGSLDSDFELFGPPDLPEPK